MQFDVDRLFALVRRELGAEDVHVHEPDGEPPPESERALQCRLPDGRSLVVRFEAPPPERETKQRRLEMLASTFDVFVDEPMTRPRSRPPVARSLQDELKALCGRASSVNALVIDANSPVVWGAARSRGLGSEWPVAGDPGEADRDDKADDGAPPVDAPSRAAIEAARGLPALAALRKGRHMRHIEHDGPGPFLAHSFAGIYLLLVVFDAAFDELRAERAVAESLARVEQLVLALPPLDPSPGAGEGAIAMSRPRRR